MVPVSQLWLSIILASAMTFIAGFVLWMVLPLHRKDYGKTSDEDALRDVVRRQGLPPGQYIFPYGGSPQAMKDPAFMKKQNEGPNGALILWRSGPPALAGNLVRYFVFLLVVSFVIGYVASRTMATGTTYGQVYRVTFTIAVLAYGAAVVPAAIWYGKPWSVAIRELIDAVVFAALTAGSFAGFWPR